MNIITGYKGTPHVTAQQDRDINSAIFTDGVYILNVGSQLSATIVSANEVTIADGIAIAQGCAAEIARGTSESMTIDNGTQGQLRKDLIVLRYTKDASTGVEDMELAVIKGTPAASNPATPTYTRGAIADGDALVEFPLYEVNLSGITIQSVVLLATKKSIADKKSVDDLSAKIGTGTLSTTAKNLIGAVNELLTKIGTGTLSTTTKNVIGAINELVSRLSATEAKTAGIVRTSAFSLAAGGTDYKQLSQVATYLLIVDSAYPSDTMKGLYLIGVSGDSQISIKAVSGASAVAITDGGNALLKIKNNGNAYIRYTLVTTYAG